MGEENLRHTALADPLYELRLIPKGDPDADLHLLLATTDYVEALDCAFDHLHEHDPMREGKVAGLAIVRVQGNDREPVWVYSHDETNGAEIDSVGIWGFNVGAWTGPPSAIVGPRRETSSGVLRR